MLFRGAVTAVSELSAHTYYSILRVDLTPRPDVLVVAAHMVSLLEKERHDVDQELEAMSAAIREAEDRAGHSRTVLVGDLNANPFDPGVASARGLHGVMSRVIAGRDTRRVSHRDYPMFFNPMWGFFGDDEWRAAGTYYREGSGGHLVYYWHMYDQVLIRPALLPGYQPDSVQIITNVGGTRLTRSDWRPDRDVGSDHLPVRVQLDH